MVASCPVVNFGTWFVAELDLHGTTLASEAKAHIGLYGTKVMFGLHAAHSSSDLKCLSNLLFHFMVCSSLTHQRSPLAAKVIRSLEHTAHVIGHITPSLLAGQARVRRPTF